MAPRAQPAWRLKEAALEYAAAVELGDGLRQPWDRLRKAAIRYKATPRPKGRPRKVAA